MKNFRRFAESTTVAFQPGLTVVGGENGAGKSTMIEALLYVLFGTQKGRSDGIRSDNATEDPEVCCELTLHNHDVVIKRTGSVVELHIDGAIVVQPLPGSHTSAQRKLATLLGDLTRDQFERTYIALQGDTAGLVDENAGVRRKIIENILQLDVLQRAFKMQEEQRTLARNSIIAKGNYLCDLVHLEELSQQPWRKFQAARGQRQQQDQIQRFQVKMQQAIQQCLVDATAAADSAGQAQCSYQHSELVYQQSYDKLEDAKSTLSQQDELRDCFFVLEHKISKYDGQIALLEHQLAGAELEMKQAQACAQASQRFDAHVTERDRLRERFSTLRTIKFHFEALEETRRAYEQAQEELNALGDVDIILVAAQRRADGMHQQWDALQQHDPTTAVFNQLHSEEGRLKQQQQEAEYALDTLDHNPGNALCPTCYQPLAAHTLEQRRHDLRQWLGTALPALLHEQEQHYISLKAEQERWKQQCNEVCAIWQRILNTDVEEARNNVQQRDWLRQDVHSCKQKLDDAEQNWSQLGETSPYDPQEIDRVRDQGDNLNAEIAALKADAERFKSLDKLVMQHVSIKDQLNTMRANSQQHRVDQAATGYDDTAYEQAKLLRDTRQNELNTALREQEQARSRSREARRDADDRQKEAQAAEQHYTEFTTNLQDFQRQDQLLVLLDQFRQHFFTVNTEHILQRAAELIQFAASDQSILGIEFDGEALKYRDASHILRSISRLSGGEQALVGLCLRIALAERAQALTGTGRVRFLILDEVLSSLDGERRDAAQRIFADVLQRGVFEHIIMVTHIESVKQNWQSHGLEVLKTGSKTSVVKRFDKCDEQILGSDESEV